MRAFLVLAVLAMLAGSARADFAVNFTNNTYVVGGGLQSFDVVLSPNTAPISTGLFNMDFELLSGGSWAAPVTDLEVTGFHYDSSVVNLTPYIAGNFGGFSSIINGAASPSGSVSAARMFIDITGLSVGTYDFSYELYMEGTGLDFGNDLFASGTGSFTVTAVPEPSSLALVGMAGAGAAGYWRKKRAKKQSAVEPTVAV